MKSPRLLIQWLLAALCCSGLLAADKTARGPERLEQVLKRFPEADTDKNGKLTMEEARAYLRKMKAPKSGDAPVSPDAAAKPTSSGAPGTDTPAKLPEGKAKAVAAKKARRNGDAPKPDFADVSYGSHPNNKLDLWIAKSDKPTALVIFIHGGGFIGGDKGTVSGAALKQCLDAGVSFASINYRFRTEASLNTVLRDSARALQFLRYRAKDYNLDKHIAVFGGSAGAGTSLWLAFRDDLADPKSDDPVLRESTRVSAAASSAGQATYDILKWEAVLGSKEAMRFYPESTWPAFYGLKTPDELQSEKGKQLRADVDMLGLISKDDPPVWLGAGDNHDALANKGDTNHSPKHSEAVKKRCDEVGVPAVLKVGHRVQPDGDGNGSQIDFLLKHLGQ